MELEQMEQLQNDICEALNCAREQYTSFGQEIQNKDIVIFLGNTRGGKSTVINYLIGTPLQAFKNEECVYKIRKVNESTYGPCIGHGTLSRTSSPEIYPNRNNDIIYVDAPGFGDNRGDVKEIINAIFVHQIKHARTCKFVLVSDVCNIENDNVGEFVNLIKNICTLIPSSSLCNSVSLLITKVEDDWSQKRIGQLLDKKILQAGLNMGEDCLQLVKYFVEQNQFIALFKKPSCEGNITTASDVNMENAISNCLPLCMNTVAVNFAISDGARLAVIEVCQNFVDELNFTDELNAGTAEYRNYFTVVNYIFASTEDELNETQVAMVNWKRSLTDSRMRSPRNLQDLLNSMNDLIEFDSLSVFYKTLTLFGMLENVELLPQTIKNSVIRKYTDSLENVIEEIDTLLQDITDEQQERRNLDIAFNVSVVGSTVAVAAAAASVSEGATLTRVVGSALHSLQAISATTSTAVSTVGGVLDLSAATTGVPGVLEAIGGASVAGGPLAAITVAGAVAATGISVVLNIMRNEQIQRRRIARQQQGR